MKTKGNTILITGGGSGIGLETAKLFAANGNKVIIAGRDIRKLNNALDVVPGAMAIAADITNESEVNHLVKKIFDEFPQLDMIMNNAGKAYPYSLSEPGGVFDKAADEMLTNFLSALRLTEKLLPLLKQKDEAAVINNSSVVAFTPAFRLPSYSDSKAALHSYSQSLQQSLAQIKKSESD